MREAMNREEEALIQAKEALLPGDVAPMHVAFGLVKQGFDRSTESILDIVHAPEKLSISIYSSKN
jgi:hypothetical protein